MLSFGIIAEGPSDHQVIENILVGYLQHDREVFTNPIQPLPDAPGGWTLVFESLKRGEPQRALQFNDYVVIHIDTDVQEEGGFDVPRREGGVELYIPERVNRVIAKLMENIDTAFREANQHRLLFAVAVESIECWLLPLLHNNKKAEKTTGCLDAANAALRKANRNGLSAGETKFPPAYEQASRDYTKHKVLMKQRDRNPSLALFIKQLDALQKRAPGADKPAEESPGSDG